MDVDERDRVGSTLFVDKSLRICKPNAPGRLEDSLDPRVVSLLVSSFTR